MFYDGYKAGDLRVAVPQCQGVASQFVQCKQIHTLPCVCKIWEWRVHVGYSGDASIASVSIRTIALRFLLPIPCDDWNFLHGICVGQASNPGPWMLQLRNIVSATKHIENFSMQADCHVWSETSATTAAQNKVLKKTRKLGVSLVCSEVASSKTSKGSLVGRSAATGTMCISRARSTSLAGQWEGPVYSSGRISDALLQLNGIQVRIIAVYGYHSGIKDSLVKNDILMGKVLHRAQAFDLPVIITGDLNCDINELESWHAAVARGFVDVAARQAAACSSEPQPTYKGQSRLDYVLCNKVAALAFQCLSVDPQGFTDHAILSASFDWENFQPVIPRWSFPRALDDQPKTLEKVSSLEAQPQLYQQFSGAVQDGDTELALGFFARIYEDKVSRAYLQVASVPLPPKFLGRTRCKIQKLQSRPITPLPETQSMADGFQIFWFDKARRWLLELQALQSKNTDVAKQHVLWNKILQCGGFSPSFPEWLLSHDVVLLVPFELPSAEWIQQVVQAIQYECKLQQQLQTRQKNAMILRNMKLDWSKGGRLHSQSIKPVPLGTLDSLMVQKERPFHLLRCHKGKGAQISFSDGLPTPPGTRLTFSGDKGPIQAIVTKVAGSKIELDVPAHGGMNMKATAQQATWSTDTGYIASQIQSFWKTYWQPQRQPDMEQVADMIQCLPQIPEFDDVITALDVENAIARIPAGKARGMDGFSMLELKSFGPQEHEMLAQLFNAITKTGQWPRALLSSFVALLAKVPQPRSPKDARPITVLPTLYRLWGKIMGSRIIKALLPYLPQDLFGSVPGRSASDAAWELQTLLEQAACGADDIVGVSLDLSKAYNTIPREVVALLADKCGWPASLKRSYMAFLQSFHRFFKIHGGFHCPTHSDTGVPEGCPIAVPVMIMITFLVTKWSTADAGNARFISYVDNWTLVNTSFPRLTTSPDKVHKATSTLALLLNPDKTRAFATDPHLRQELAKFSFAGHPLQVCSTHDDLGVWFTSTLKRTSAGIHKRLEANQAKMKKLQMMPWSAQRKSDVLKRTVVPSLLHGVSWASSSATYIAALRGKFSATIWGQHHHRDHFLCPMFSLKQPFEPFLIIFRLRLADLRRAFARSQQGLALAWNTALTAPRSTGPMRYFFEMCSQLEIQPQTDMVLSIGHHSVHLCWSPMAEIMDNVTQAWMEHVAAKVQEKPGLDGIQTIDYSFSAKLRSTTAVQHHVLGSFTSNAAVSTRKKRKFLSPEDALCKHCGQEDDAEHRLLHCPYYQHARAHIPEGQALQWPTLLVTRGLSRKPTAMAAWEALNSTRPWPEMQECLDQGMHLFTDGSTEGSRSVPKAAWSVVMLEPGSFNYALVQSGPLPGKQCNYRAEMFATLVAIHSSVNGTVYIDNKSVVQGLHRLQQDGWDHLYWNKSPEIQLWREIWNVLTLKEPQSWTFSHVRSHRDFRQQPSDFQAWTAFGNEVADRYAKKANQNRESHETQIHQAALQDWAFQTQRMEQLATLQQTVFQGGQTKPSPKQKPLQGSGDISLVLGPPADHLTAVPIDTYDDALLGPRFLWVIRKWWVDQQWRHAPSGFSIAELYFFFSESTGWMSPQNLATWDPRSLPFQWRTSIQTAFAAETDYEALQFNDVCYSKQCTVFLHALKFFAHRHSLDLGFTRGQALSFLDCFEHVPQVFFAPECAPEVRARFRDRIECSWKSFKHSAFRPTCEPILCPLEVQHPMITWKRYYSQRKRKAST